MYKQLSRIYCVYIICCHINGKCYVGYTNNCDKIPTNINNSNFVNDYIKHGRQNFSIHIISNHLTLEEAQLLRYYYISKFRTDEEHDGYNALQVDEILKYTDNKFHPFTRETYKGDKKMDKQELVRKEMVEAMKEKNKPKKETLSLLLAALKNAEIDKMGILSESEEDAVVQKEIKQTKETLDLAPADRTDIIQECKYRIEVLSQFAPKMMKEEEIEATIAGVLSDLGIENPTKKEKGKIMKTLMPMVKGKADGKLVNQILEKKLA